MEIEMNIVRDRREVLAASAAVTVSAAIAQLGLTRLWASANPISSMPRPIV
jgi:hypothetical protein